MVCIGQAWEYSKAFGQMRVGFDSNGNVVSCEGNITLPIGKNSNPLGDLVGDLTVSRGVVTVDSSLFIPYVGSDPVLQAEFPQGFPPGYGAGLAFVGKTGDVLQFLTVTDRGPGVDGPACANATRGVGGAAVLGPGRVFTNPAFAPSLAWITKTGCGTTTLNASKSILRELGGRAVSGLPPSPGSAAAAAFSYIDAVGGGAGEVPLDVSGAVIQFDDDGLDPRSLAYDGATGVLWIGDAYGPQLVKVNATTGEIIHRFRPGFELPAVLARRAVRRGLSGLCLDKATGVLHGVLEGPIDPLDASGQPRAVGGRRVRDFAGFVRWARPTSQQ
jgi:hypothetical protein